MYDRPLGWLGIIRLGLVQTALGSVVVLTTSTLNRIMVVELALPAMLPGALVGLHYVLQVLRPRLGHGSDVGGRRTPWIVGGMAFVNVPSWRGRFFLAGNGPLTWHDACAQHDPLARCFPLARQNRPRWRGSGLILGHNDAFLFHGDEILCIGPVGVAWMLTRPGS